MEHRHLLNIMKYGLIQFLFLLILLPVSATAASVPSPWIRPATADSPLIWGRRDGIIFGIPSHGGMGGPRGLIRVGIMGKSGKPELINFIAIEPVIKGTSPRNQRIALSELEQSTMDRGMQGKRLWTTGSQGVLTSSSAATRAARRLTVRIEVEQFHNRAHVYLIASISSDRPDELALEVHSHGDSALIDELTVTATMGNYERLRHLWLNDAVVDSRSLYKGYAGNDFVEKQTYPLSRMLRLDGDAIAIATSNEPDPSAVRVAAKSHWTYRSKKLTQYWRVPEQDIQPNLRIRVNGRRVYWLSQRPVPGGIAFENFEVRQHYVPGQTFIYGLTPRAPGEWTPPIPGLTVEASLAFGSDKSGGRNDIFNISRNVYLRHCNIWVGVKGTGTGYVKSLSTQGLHTGAALFL